MSKLQQFYGTAVGKKFVVAVTGVIMVGDNGLTLHGQNTLE
jgi:hypothetical protein